MMLAHRLGSITSIYVIWKKGGNDIVFMYGRSWNPLMAHKTL